MGVGGARETWKEHKTLPKVTSPFGFTSNSCISSMGFASGVTGIGYDEANPTEPLQIHLLSFKAMTLATHKAHIV